MNSLCSNLAALLLIAHAMFGCCRCHWHNECAADDRIETPPLCACCPCGHCHQEQLDSASRPQPKPCDCEHSCHSVCTYLPASRLLLDNTHAAAGVDSAAVLPPRIEKYCAFTTSCSELLATNTAPRLSVRLHLLHHFLLI